MDSDFAEWIRKLDRCRTPDAVQELADGAAAAERWGVQAYTTEMRQAAARRMAEVVRMTRSGTR